MHFTILLLRTGFQRQTGYSVAMTIIHEDRDSGLHLSKNGHWTYYQSSSLSLYGFTLGQILIFCTDKNLDAFYKANIRVIILEEIENFISQILYKMSSRTHIYTLIITNKIHSHPIDILCVLMRSLL